MRSTPVILAPSGFPWRAAFIGLVVLEASMMVGLFVLGVGTVGGTFVVSALIGGAAFAAALG